MNVVLRIMEAAVEFVWWGGRVVVVGFAESSSCPTQLQCCVMLSFGLLQ